MKPIYNWVARRIAEPLPRRVMYFALNRAMIEIRETYGDAALLSIHINYIRSEYGNVGQLGHKRLKA